MTADALAGFVRGWERGVAFGGHSGWRLRSGCSGKSSFFQWAMRGSFGVGGALVCGESPEADLADVQSKRIFKRSAPIAHQGAVAWGSVTRRVALARSDSPFIYFITPGTEKLKISESHWRRRRRERRCQTVNNRTHDYLIACKSCECERRIKRKGIRSVTFKGPQQSATSRREIRPRCGIRDQPI